MLLNSFLTVNKGNKFGDFGYCLFIRGCLLNILLVFVLNPVALLKHLVFPLGVYSQITNLQVLESLLYC